MGGSGGSDDGPRPADGDGERKRSLGRRSSGGDASRKCGEAELLRKLWGVRSITAVAGREKAVSKQSRTAGEKRERRRRES